MSTEAAPPAPVAGAISSTNLPRSSRGTTTGPSRLNSSRGPRRGGAGASRGAGGASKKSPTAESSSDWAEQDPSDTSEEVTQLKIKYADQLKVLKDVFPDWTTEDLLFALQEADGDVTVTINRISGG